MRIECNIDLHELFYQLDEDDIIKFTCEDVLDAVVSTHIKNNWHTKITHVNVKDFINLLANNFDDIVRNADPHQMQKIRDIVNGN